MADDNYWVRSAGMNRRRFMGSAGAAGVGVAALGVVGCGGDDTKPVATTTTGGSATAATGSSPAAAQPKRGGTISAAQPQVPLSDVFDPHQSLAQAAFFWTLIGNVTTRPSLDATKLEAELVEKWEIPGDGTQINLTIRPNVVWHNKPPTNGRAFTADDLAFNLTRITGKLNPEKLASFQRASTLPNFLSATAVDEKTVQVKLTKPHSGFLFGMSDWRNTIIPRDFVEKGGDFAKPATLVGTGPWVMDTFNDGGKSVFKPNPKWWEQGKPYANEVNWIGYGDTLSQQTGFGKGDIDVVAGGNKLANETIKKIKSDARLESWTFGSWNHIRFNTTKKPFDDPRVRLGLFRIFDYKSWNDSFYGDSSLWEYTGPLAAAFTVEAIPSAEIAKLPGYNPATRAADIKAGKDMIAAAGFPDGKGLSFKFMPSGKTGISYETALRAQDDIKSNLSGAQVEVDIPADFAVFGKRQVSGEWDVISYTLFPAPDAVIEMTNNTYSTGGRNYGKFKDANIDALIDKAASQLDTKARAETLKQAQKLLIETLMPTIHYSQPKMQAFFQPRLKGMEKYGGRIGGGSYDTSLNFRNAWIA